MGYYEVEFITMDGNEVTRDFKHFNDENEAKQFFNDLKSDPEIVRIKRTELFKGDGKNYLGGSEGRDRFVNKEPEMHRLFLNSRLGDKRFVDEDYFAYMKRKKQARNEFLQLNEMKPGDEQDIAQKRFDRLTKSEQTKLLQIMKMMDSEKKKTTKEAKDAFSGYFSKTNLGQMIIDAEEILASGMQNGEPLDNETEMLVRQELERLKQLYIDNHGYTGMMATAEPNNKKEKVMKFLKSKKTYRENMNLESIYEDLKENEGQGKTISLYPFYNEELAQKLFAMGINDGYDWDDFLVKKLGGLSGGYWEGDPEGDGTMMYNVKEPLYSELKNGIKILLKRIMTDTLEEGQLNEWTLGYDYPNDPDGECVSNGYVDFDITFAVKGWPSGRETVPASEFEAFVKEANAAITDYFKKQGAIQNLDIKNSLTLGDEYKDFDKEGDNYSFGSFAWKIQGDVEGIAAMEDEVIKEIAPKVKELAQNIQKYTWLDPSKIMIDDVESDLEYTC